MGLLAGMAAEEYERYYLEMSSPAITPPSTPNAEPFDSNSLDDLPPEEHELYYLSMSSPVHDGSDEPHWLQVHVETDPSIPDKYGFCFWDKLPVEIKDIIFEDVFVLNNTIAAVDKHAIDSMLTCRWDVRKRHKKTMMASSWPLTVSKEWHRAYSQTFCSLVHFEFQSPEHWRSFASHVTFSRFLVSITLTLDRPCSVGPKEVIVACPSLRSLCLAVTTCWFSAKIGWDICADPWSESDFQQYAPSRALLRSLRGRSEIAVQLAVVETDRWPRLKEQGRPIFSKNMAEFLRVAEAASKLPKPTSSYPSWFFEGSSAPSMETAIPDLPEDPSIPHDDGTCFWDELPLELMQMIIELVYPTGQRIRPVTSKDWLGREQRAQAKLKRKDRTSGRPFPGIFLEMFLGVSKIWFQAASELFYSRAVFSITPDLVLMKQEPYLRNLTTVSIGIFSVLDVRGLARLIAEYPAITRVTLKLDEYFFREMIEQDLCISTDPVRETDFEGHKPTVTLLRSIYGVPTVKIHAVRSSATSKQPRSERNAFPNERRLAPLKFDAPGRSSSSVSGKTATAGQPSFLFLRVDDLPDTPAKLSALLENNSAGLIDFHKRNQSSLLEYIKSLKSNHSKRGELHNRQQESLNDGAEQELEEKHGVQDEP
ncbi:uncharacterized protein MYCGRDRAFT_94566 [Zymoseptoria tritici IPO323]|uniref:F-box domain-containing protein n=1 Tax=Zymoseptoria tritici (strain CBS 115943 / IPO323) TaxID=336722 RepID=F9XG38_ZYMTI|nr:uncharacterized protein MYCGRDRAFT_94566 [Zymoseptoria tritici IPO323]EGP85725.1 hypothetical protein MYCGRDRAFT_94566 [Zymoseptoria tritici IPO323]